MIEATGASVTGRTRTCRRAEHVCASLALTRDDILARSRDTDRFENAMDVIQQAKLSQKFVSLLTARTPVTVNRWFKRGHVPTSYMIDKLVELAYKLRPLIDVGILPFPATVPRDTRWKVLCYLLNVQYLASTY